MRVITEESLQILCLISGWICFLPKTPFKEIENSEKEWTNLEDKREESPRRFPRSWKRETITKLFNCTERYNLGIFISSIWSSRYEASEKYMEADAITLDGILNMNKYGQVHICTITFEQIDYLCLWLGRRLHHIYQNTQLSLLYDDWQYIFVFLFFLNFR